MILISDIRYPRRILSLFDGKMVKPTVLERYFNAQDIWRASLIALRLKNGLYYIAKSRQTKVPNHPVRKTTLVRHIDANL